MKWLNIIFIPFCAFYCMKSCGIQRVNTISECFLNEHVMKPLKPVSIVRRTMLYGYGCSKQTPLQTANLHLHSACVFDRNYVYIDPTLIVASLWLKHRRHKVNFRQRVIPGSFEIPRSRDKRTGAKQKTVSFPGFSPRKSGAAFPILAYRMLNQLLKVFPLTVQSVLVTQSWDIVR